jgi:spore germination protein YaaH
LKKLVVWLCTAVFLFLLPGFSASAADYKFNMSYIYFGNSSGYTSLVDDAQSSLNEVAPNYFTLDASGGLTLTNAVSPSFINDMHARGVRVVPYISNEWNRQAGINALNNRSVLANAIAQAVQAYNLDGINLDFENLTQDQRADYVDFVRLLRQALPTGKTIAVAVAANPNGWTNGWQGSYDYKGLSDYADYIFIMAYDEHWDGSKPGPVASIGFVEQSIQYALECQVPSEKIVLGLPFYGRIWSDAGTSPKGYGVGNYKIDQLIQRYGGTVSVDNGSLSAKAVITVKPGTTPPVIGGKTLAAGTYTIWYDNEQTLKAKLKLVHTYNLRGAGSWSLGQETASTWDYYRLWVNGCTFNDVQNHWAKDYVFSAYMNGWVNGFSTDAFAPDAPLTRAQAAAMLVRLFGYTPTVSGDGFDDTNGSWAEAYIDTARQYHLVSGVGGNRFDPDRPVSRQEIAVMLNNILYYTTSGQPVFSDVTKDSNSWSYDAIAALSEAGVITGRPDGSFLPQANLNRAEMAALLTRIQAKSPVIAG